MPFTPFILAVQFKGVWYFSYGVGFQWGLIGVIFSIVEIRNCLILESLTSSPIKFHYKITSWKYFVREISSGEIIVKDSLVLGFSVTVPTWFHFLVLQAYVTQRLIELTQRRLWKKLQDLDKPEIVCGNNMQYKEYDKKEKP